VTAVSIIIVTWRSANYIRPCLSSIYRFTHRTSFEIIVVDNGSNDQTVEIIRRGFPHVRLFVTAENLGFPRASNLAMGHSRGRFLFLLNPDTRLQSDVVGTLVDFLEAHPEAGAAGPRILEKDGSAALFAAREFPSLTNAILRQFGLRRLFPRNKLLGRETLGDWDHNTTRAVPCLTGAALMITAGVFASVGPLDEQLPMYFEDLDVCARIAVVGKRLYYVGEAELVHLGGQSASQSPVRPLLYAMENGQAPWLYIRKYCGPGRAACFSATVLLGSLFRVVLSALLSSLTGLGAADRGREFRRGLAKSLALLRWSISRKNNYADRLSGLLARQSFSSPTAFLQAPPKVEISGASAKRGWRLY
jgi:GT2 family glycosyltransferase